MKLNREEIVKALEDAMRMGDAPVGKYWGCMITKLTAKEAVDLINRQKAEIERLEDKIKKAKDKVIETIPLVEEDIKTAKSEAYKEFAEEYKDQIKNYTGMFTDDGFMVNLEAVLSAVDFIKYKLVGDENG